jgi:hypothetical protein
MFELFKSLDISDIIYTVMKSEAVQDKIIQLNQSQLKDKGIDSEGKPIETYNAGNGLVYSPFTVEKKKEKGQRWDIVTFFDKGNFFKTFSTIVNTQFSRVVANSKKDDGDISDNVNMDKVYGLTKESIAILSEFIRPLTIKEFRRRLKLV